MKVMVVYDSMWGNTEKIAGAIAGGAGSPDNVLLRRAAEFNPTELQNINLLIIGVPTQGGRPTVPVQQFLNKITSDDLKNVKVAVFDTRLATKLVGIFGFAAGKITDSLKKIGITLVAPPEGFYVKSSKGPLKDGELERAAKWGKTVAEKSA